MVDFEEEIGIRQRFLYCYQQLKTRQDMTDKEFVHSIGLKNKSLIVDLQTGRIKISLSLIFKATHAHPEFFNKAYILLSLDVPLINIPTLTPGPKAAAKPAKKAIGRPRKLVQGSFNFLPRIQ